MPTIFDNLADETRLGNELRMRLPAWDRLDVATGYLDLRGWAHISDLIDKKMSERARPEPVGGVSRDGEAAAEPLVRVLVGMLLPADAKAMLAALQETIHGPEFGSEYNDMVKARRVREGLVAHLREQLTTGMPTAGARAALRSLRDQLAAGAVQMKVFTDAPLHGKTYILNAPGNLNSEIRGYVGSSNFTGAGLAHNLELNIDVTDVDAALKLASWFDDRWVDPFSLDITAEIIDLIEASWAAETQPTPYEVYLKVCHSMSADAREGMGYVLPPSMQALLLDYQETAVRTLARRLVRRGGAMLGDVVGLGKTLTAVATALMLEAAEDYTTLVLCPRNLELMWREHLEAYGLVGADVVPYSIAAKVLPEKKRYHLLICDESHNLRNATRQDYHAIHDYVRLNGSRVLLLTATPYNLSFKDVANQIGLYLDDDVDLGLQPSAALARDPHLADKVDGKISTLGAFRLSEEAEDWRRLMSDHLVRRTRSFIRRGARTETVVGEDGKSIQREYLEFASGERFHFPERIARPLVHAFAENDPARLMEDDQTIDAIESLRLPRYRLAEYDDPRRTHSEDDLEILDDIRSGRGNVSGFVRVGLYKRLTSSGHSFILSLQRQRARNEIFLHAIASGLSLPVGSFIDPRRGLMDADIEAEHMGVGVAAQAYEELRRTLPEHTKWISSGVFSDDLRVELQADNQAIGALLARYGAWEPARDSKLGALAQLLTDTHAGDKVLVFTEYSDTAEYVARALAAAGIDRVGLATGDTDAAQIARRFSPDSNRVPGQEHSAEPAGDEEAVEVLIATDVLSEGQNLQDAHVVVNYDLPWAIIRIIQRAGRVDRIGQRSDKVFVYLITHERIDDQINLRQRIKARLGAAAEAFGSDEQFFGSEDEVRILEGLYQGRVPDDLEDLEGEADAVSEAWLVWSLVRQRDPQLAEKVISMQDMVHSTRALQIRERQSGVVCHASTGSGVDAFAVSLDSPLGSVERLLTPLEALRYFRAEPTTPTVSVREDHLEREAALVRDKLATETVAQGNLRGVRLWAWKRLSGTLHGDLAAAALDALHERPLTHHASQRLRDARRHRYRDEDLAELLNQLHGEGRLAIGAGEVDALRIVCSIGMREL